MCTDEFLKAQDTIRIITTASAPANPNLKQYLSTNRVMSTLTYIGPASSRDVYIYGTIQSLSSTLQIITTKSLKFVQLSRGKPLPVVIDASAFGNLSPNNINISGQGAGNIDPNNIILPNGMYNICIAASFENDCNNPGCFFYDQTPVCGTFNIIDCNQVNGAFINTFVTPPTNPIIDQFIMSGGVNSKIQFNGVAGCNASFVKLFGKIERLSPSPFSIALKSDYTSQQTMTLFPGSQTQITTDRQIDAFANFDETSLIANGIDLASIKDLNGRLKLPDGNYRICFYAKYFDSSTSSLGTDASNPNLGCGSFTICNQAGGAPQFTQPINSLNINSEIPLVRPASPIIFAWLAPQSTCGLPPGGFKYDLEIWELLDNQNVTDAINNPFVFRKMGLPSTTFLLDTNLNKNVLQEGKRYAIRVRAVSAKVLMRRLTLTMMDTAA